VIFFYRVWHGKYQMRSLYSRYPRDGKCNGLHKIPAPSMVGSSSQCLLFSDIVRIIKNLTSS
jgi:hypothetical protein